MRMLLWLLAPLSVGMLIAAPIPKKTEEKYPPPTEEQLTQSKKNLREIGLGLHNYESAFGVFPTNVVKDKKLTLSWRVQILPYLGDDELALWRQFKMDEPWDSENNKKLIEKIPPIYQPIRIQAKKGQTYYRGITGAGTFFEYGAKMNVVSITDGTSNTIGVIEAGEPCIWTKPDDVVIDPKKDLPKFGKLFDGTMHCLFLDGSVRRLTAKQRESMDMKVWFTKAGGEVAEWPQD